MGQCERRLYFKEQGEDYLKWGFKPRLCSSQEGLNGGELSPIMQPDWPSLIRIISAHCFPAASDPLNPKRFCLPTSRSVSHCDLLLLNRGSSVGYSKHFFRWTEVLGLTGSSEPISRAVILWQEGVVSPLKRCPPPETALQKGALWGQSVHLVM